MGYQSVLFLFYLLLPSLLLKVSGRSENDDVYIIYMGAAFPGTASFRSDRAGVLSLLLRQKNNSNSIIRSYRHGISGFAARLSAAEAQQIAQKPGVVSVFPDPVFQLHTTRSWDFLKYQTDVEIESNPKSESSNSSSRGYDTIIGTLDSGISPESESFSDKDMGPIPSRWKGSCKSGQEFNTSNCNRKLIGAKYFTEGPDEDDDEFFSPRDFIGHGTHVASTAAGAVVQGASYYGLAAGTAKGGSPSSRIASYRVCEPDGCLGSNILAAFDEAIADGVDVLSISLGSSSLFIPELQKDPIAIGSFHAVQNGIVVICSAGNDGPDSGTVVNTAPWIMTVGATTIDRSFESTVVLGGNKVIKGEAINFADIQKKPSYPLTYAKYAKKANASDQDASNCTPGSLDEDKIKGKIVLCSRTADLLMSIKQMAIQDLGGIGLILADDHSRGVASNFLEFPMTVISSKDGTQILTYINSTQNPVATILPTVAKEKYKPAPAVAYFSARGPASGSRNILKPDIVAPGVNILAAWRGGDKSMTPKGRDFPLYNVISGTSMATPHVSGIAAEVKSQNPTWTPSAIKSAIMTTASQTNNIKGQITTESGDIASPYDIGAGEMSTTGPLNPGLVYETTTLDYLNYLCYYGYNTSSIKVISNTLPDGFACPKQSSVELISNINYPSISVSNLKAKQSRDVTRTLTNVGGDGDTTYTPTIELMSQTLQVKVAPVQLRFTKNGQKLSYQVTFSAISTEADTFGSITWSNGNYKVRIPFAVSGASS
ncbi:hypothetical protein K2173_007423 [Erythroxylum novogranatense]|uniref:Uncharacterized protein n=1 Tax=Erythroxylum novogranatense TaxID=1862640 RepID=A0AAV8T659_9ROSI|nr:hypothetical protein K2173_007423 [Erythroxylum novogranatense]